MLFKKRKAISDETNVEKIEHKSKKNMALGTIFGYIAIFASFIYGFFLTPEIINFVGDNEYGIYGLASTIITMFIVDFGLATAVNTYLAKLRAAGDKDGVERFLSSMFKMYLTLDIVFIVIIAALYFSAPYVFANTYGNPVTFERTEHIKILQYSFVIVGCYSCISLPCSTFNGVISTYEKFSMVKIFDLIQKVAYLVVSILAIQLRWTINGSGILVIVLVNVVTATFSIILRYIYMVTYLNVHLKLSKRITKEEKKDVFKFSAWGFVMNVTSRLAFNVTPIVLGVTSNEEAITVFALITTIELYIYLIGDMTGGFFMAKLARTEAEGTSEEKLAHLQRLAEKVGKIQFVIVALIVGGFFAVGQEFVLLWMRTRPNPHNYITIYWCIVAMCGYEVVHLPELIFQNAMLTHGQIKPIAIASIAKAIVNLSLSFLLTYFFTRQFGNMWFGAGAIGASLAIMVARVVDLIVNNFIYKKYLKVDLGHFFATVFGRGGITLIISLGAGFALHLLPILDFNNTLKFFVNGVLFVIIYIICTIFITFTKEERQYYVGAVFELLHIKKKKPKVAAVIDAPVEENKEIEAVEPIEDKKDD